MIMIGASAGLTLRMVGGAGRLVGSWPPAALIAACTSSAAPSRLRDSSNCSSDRRAAERARGGHLRDAGNQRELALERRGDVRGHGLGTGAGQRGADLQGRKVDHRHRRDRQVQIGHDPDHQSRGREQRGRDRTGDEGGGDVHRLLGIAVLRIAAARGGAMLDRHRSHAPELPRR